MSQVRETIDLLTKLLRANGTSRIKPETFRLAKFDKVEATVPLWKLLFELLYFLENGIIDEVAVKACAELTAEELVIYVKHGLQDRGFLSKAFSQLPNDMSSGSRELLLALAWLLATQAVIDKFMDSCASPIDTDLQELKMVNPNQQVTMSQPPPTATVMTPVQKIQQLQLLNGKLQLSLRQLYSLQRERTRLQHRVHESTHGVSLDPDKGHLSVLEVCLLRHPDYLKKILKLLEKDNERLQYMLAWKEQEEVFWKWMASVVDINAKESREQEANSVERSPMIHYNIPPDVIGQMSMARKQLETAILKYEPIIDKLEEMWETKRMCVDSAYLDSLLSSIESEINHQKLNFSSSPENTFPKQMREPQLVYIKNSPSKKSTNVRQSEQSRSSFTSAPDEGQGQQADIQTEIEDLEDHIRRLEFQVERKQQRYMTQLNTLAGEIPDTICIQPKSLR